MDYIVYSRKSGACKRNFSYPPIKIDQNLDVGKDSFFESKVKMQYFLTNSVVEFSTKALYVRYFIWKKQRENWPNKTV